MTNTNRFMKVFTWLMMLFSIANIITFSIEKTLVSDITINTLVEEQKPQSSSVIKDNVAEPLPLGSPLKLKIDTSKYSSDLNYVLPLRGTVNVSVNWGDGVTTTHTTASDVEHKYNVGGIYTIEITGSLTGFGQAANSVNYNRGILKLVEVLSFGNIGITNFKDAFRGANNLIAISSDFPSGVTNIEGMFDGNINLVTADVSNWDTSLVTSMARTFNYARKLNPNVTNWKTASVLDMQSMFAGASEFNQPITKGLDGVWDTSKVTNMSQMFYLAAKFNQPLDSWDTSSVTNLYRMFFGASAFNQPINSWDVSKVTNFEGLFYGATLFNQPIGDWVTSSATTMKQMFYNTIFNQEIGNWDVSKVTDFTGMFSATSFNKPLTNWNTQSAVTMAEMFNYAKEFNQDLSHFNTASVINLNAMFSSAFKFDQNINNWNTANVVTMYQTFRNTTVFNQPLNNWNVEKVTNFSEMFAYSKAFNQPLDQWKTTSAQNFNSLFRSSNFNQPLNMWTVSTVTNMESMFADNVVFNQPLDAWDVSKVENFTNMFNGARVFNQPLNSWKTDSAKYFGGMFSYALVFNQDLNLWNTSKVTNMWDMFRQAEVFNGNITTWDTSLVVSMSSMFNNAFAFNQNISAWNTSSLSGYGLNNTFNGAKVFNQNINGWTVTNVTNLDSIFKDATSFNQPLNTWNTAKVNSFYQTFYGATSFNQDISTWNTSVATNLVETFAGATSFNQPLDTWNISNVTNLRSTFSNATAFNKPLNSWNTSKVTTMESMFYHALSFNQQLNNWNTSLVTNMDSLFASNNAKMAFNQNLSSWDFSKVRNLRSFMGGVELSPYYFDQLLDRFLTQTITLDNYWSYNALKFSYTKYAKPSESKIQSLITQRGWSIETGGKLVLIINVENASKAVGEADPAYTLTYTGLYGSDTSSVVKGTATITRVEGETMGSYPLSVSGFVEEDFYYVEFGSGTQLTILSPDLRTITFEEKGGSAVADISQDLGTPITAPANPTKAGYRFDGWYTDSLLTNPYTFTTMPSENITLYAKWTVAYMVIFETNGGSELSPLFEEPNYLVEISTLPKPIKTNYMFSNWYIDESLTTEASNFRIEDTNVTLYAKWLKATTIYFDTNGGSAFSPIVGLPGAWKNIPFDVPTKEGYTFSGWYTDALLTTLADTGFYMPSEDQTLYAKWTVNQYKVTYFHGTNWAYVTFNYGEDVIMPIVTYNQYGYEFGSWYVDTNLTTPFESIPMPANDFTLYIKPTPKLIPVHLYDGFGNLIETMNIPFDSNYLETLPTPLRDGYTFTGWYRDAYYNYPVISTSKISSTSAHYMYAKWSLKQYTVTFVPNGGTLISGNLVVTKDFGASIGFPYITQVGYSIEGYYLDEALTNKYNSYFVPAMDITLYIKWVINKYNVNFITNGGSMVDTQSIEHNGVATLPVDPTQTGYDFMGWYTDSNFNQAYDFSTAITSTTTIYAKWTPKKYTISFDSNGGSSLESIEVDYNSILNLPIPTKLGYTHEWYTDASLTEKFTSSTMTDGNLQLYAKWIINAYTITFDTNGGSEVASITQDYDTLITSPENPTRLGYTFNGWDKALPTSMPAENVTLKATWLKISYTITYETNGGVNHLSNPTQYDVETPSFSLLEPTKLGYTFMGWFEDVNHSGNPIETINASRTEDVVLYAKWSINSYTITFDTNGGSLIEPLTQPYNSALVSPQNPSREGYIFNGWSQALPQTMPANDLTIKAFWVMVNPITDMPSNVDYNELLNAIDPENVNGKDVEVVLSIIVNPDLVPVSDHEIIQTKVNNNQGVILIDISIYLKEMGQQDQKVSQLNQTITLTISIPEEQRGFKNYQIVRVHEGNYEVLESIYDEVNGTLQFNTDKFSTYAIIYNEASSVNWTWWFLLIFLILIIFILLFAKRDKNENTQELVLVSDIKEDAVVPPTKTSIHFEPLFISDFETREKYKSNAAAYPGDYLEITPQNKTNNRLAKPINGILPATLVSDNHFIFIKPNEVTKLMAMPLHLATYVKLTPGVYADPGYYIEIDTNHQLTYKVVFVKKRTPPTSHKGYRWIKIEEREIKSRNA